MSCCAGSTTYYGVWRSLVARLTGGQEVVGSNPVAPIMKILVISDTHRTPQRVKKVMEQEDDIDLLFHLGDFQGGLEYIEEICKVPVKAVRGNCDFTSSQPEERLEEVCGYTFFLTHGHRYGVNYDLIELEEVARACGADVAIFGHIHKPVFNRMEDGFLLLNPGSLSEPRQYPPEASYMILEIDEETGKLYVYKRTIKV
jgi:uncharacterized protein